MRMLARMGSHRRQVCEIHFTIKGEKLMTRPNLAGGLGSGIASGFPAHVSIMGQRFTLVDGAGEKEGVETFDPKLGPYLDCVIVDVNAKVSRMFYLNDTFDPDNPAAPDCWSDNGVAPSVNAASPQSAECGTCPKAAWGSATSKVTGKGIPACKSYKKIAILIPGGDEVYLLSVPPNSLRAVQAYSQKVSGFGVDVCDIITRVSFQAGTLGTLVFDAVGHADTEMKALVERIWEAGGCPQIVGRNDQPRLAAPVQAPQITAAPPPAPPQDFLKQQAEAFSGLPEKKPRGRPRTVVDAPKNSLEAPFKPQQAQVTNFPTPQHAGLPPLGEKFGIAQNAPEPNPQLSSQLDALFSTKFGN
jgi:hypothetical protein